MFVAYARTSTTEQAAGLQAQERDLRAAVGPVADDERQFKLFAEQTSSIGKRDKLEAAIAYVRDGDTLIVTKLDRLCRSVADMGAIVKRLHAKGCGLRILAMQLDTTTATGKLMLNLLGSVAEFEREIMLERQREGIAKAKCEGKYKGRAPTARAKADQIHKLAADGMTRDAIAAKLEIGVASVYRVLAAAA